MAVPLQSLHNQPLAIESSVTICDKSLVKIDVSKKIPPLGHVDPPHPLFRALINGGDLFQDLWLILWVVWRVWSREHRNELLEKWMQWIIPDTKICDHAISCYFQWITWSLGMCMQKCLLVFTVSFFHSADLWAALAALVYISAPYHFTTFRQ
jgi:hypothetical protein